MPHCFLCKRYSKKLIPDHCFGGPRDIRQIIVANKLCQNPARLLILRLAFGIVLLP